MEINKSIAIIGEGETEWYYFDSLRRTKRYPFKVAPGFPQHSDIQHIAKLAQDYVREEYDYVVCLTDMDRLLRHPKEMGTYLALRKKLGERVTWIETSPCTEFWFLLHFLPQLAVKRYDSYEDCLPDLQRYMPGYEKTARYFRRTNLYKYLSENGDVERAVSYSEQLDRLSEASPEDRIAYTQMHRLFKILSTMQNGEEEPSKTENQKRNGTKEQEILDFIANNANSDIKTISKAVGLKASRTRFYIAKLIDEECLACTEERQKRYYIK